MWFESGEFVINVRVLARTPLIDDEEQLSTESLQILSDGSLQLRDVTPRDVSSFTCLLPLPDDPRLAVAETFAITLLGLSTTVITAVYIAVPLYLPAVVNPLKPQLLKVLLCAMQT